MYVVIGFCFLFHTKLFLSQLLFARVQARHVLLLNYRRREKKLFSLLSFQEGKYHEALSRWEAALTLAPDNAILHEQKAQVLLEVGDAWHALTAATSILLFSPSNIYPVVLQKRTCVGNNTNCSTDYYCTVDYLLYRIYSAVFFSQKK